jgi:site-specific DNA-methyltransferase (adenine-specific)
MENIIDTIQCMDAVEFLQSLPDDSVDMGITSPPYDNLRTYNGYEFNFETIAHEAYRVLKPGGVLVWIVGDATINGSETLTSMRQALYFVDVVGFKMHDTMIWEKVGNPFVASNRYIALWEYMFVFCKGKIKTTNLQLIKTTGHGGGLFSGRNRNGKLKRRMKPNKDKKPMGNIWVIATHGFNTTKDKEAYQHPAMFPEKLAERHILTWSNPGDVVMDFFMGSGTSAKMARKNGRHYIGCDISQEYVDLANARLAKPYTPDMFIDEPASDDKPEQTNMEL